MTYELVRSNFIRKLWNWKMVKQAIGRIITQEEFNQIMHDGVPKVITAVQYKEITGEDFAE